MNIQISTRMIGAENIASFSGQSFATFFGVISPKIRTRTVRTTVETVAPMSPYSLTKSTVPIDAAARLTMLFPISIVESNLS